MRNMNNETVENGNSHLASSQEESQPLVGLLQIALRHRWIILLATGISLAAAFGYVLKATPIYSSLSRLYVEQEGPKIINDNEGVMTRSGNYLYTQGELIRSTPIVADMADEPDIRYLRTFANVDNIVAYVKKRMKITVGRRDDIITVSFDSPYPSEAARLVNALVDSYIRYHSTRKRTTASEVLSILQKEKTKRDKELSDKFAEMLEFTSKNGIVSFDTKGGNVVIERLSRLSSALTDAQLMALNAKADFEAVKSMADEPSKVRQFALASTGASVGVFADDRESQLHSELRNCESEYSNATYHCTEDHPSVQAIKVKIDRIKQELDDQARGFADAYVEVMRLRWLAATEREDELQVSFDAQREASQELGVRAAEYSALQSELNRAERICEILDNRIKELNVTEDVGALNISILEVARPADAPCRPQKARILSLALMLGLIFGCGLAFLREWLDYRLRSAEEISAVLGIPVLGVVPTISRSRRIVFSRWQEAWLKLRGSCVATFRRVRSRAGSLLSWRKVPAEKPSLLAGAAAARDKRTIALCGASTVGKEAPWVRPSAVSGDKVSVEQQRIVSYGQIVHQKPKSVVAEAYRTIRTAVFFGSPKEKAKIILVTSPEPGDGKSTLASNLAIAMAQAGQKTLVVDADFRRPMQNRIFEVNERKGLSGVLVGRQVIETALQSGPLPGLDILACGPEVPNPSELLNSDAFGETLKTLSKQYDRVIIDSPPVGPVADAQILAAFCDAVVLVLRAEKSTRRHSRQARDSLLGVGAHILGAVVNDVRHKHGKYGYYSAYAYYDSYGYYGKGQKKTG